MQRISRWPTFLKRRGLGRFNGRGLQGKLTLMLVLLLANAMVVGCSQPSSVGDTIMDYKPSLSFEEAKGLTQQEIAYQIMDKWLSHHLSRRVCKRIRLQDYRIQKDIGIVEERETGFVATVLFSVKPTAAYSDWIAGNGVFEGGWVRHKFLFVTIIQTDKGYALEGAGTGP